MSLPSLVHVSSSDGDWEGIYINGTLFDQNHSIDLRNVLALFDELGLINFTERELDFEHLNIGSLPVTYEGLLADIEQQRMLDSL